MDLYLGIPLIALVAIMQSTVTSHLRLLGSSPDLVLLCVTSWVLLRGLREGLIWALVGGLMLDAFSGMAFGLASVALLVATILVGMAESNIFRVARFLPYISIAIGTIIYYTILIFLHQMISQDLPWGPSLGRVVLPTILVNTLTMPVVFYGLSWLRTRLGPRTVEWQ